MWEIKQWLSAGIKHSEGSVMVLGCPSARVVGDLIENELWTQKSTDFDPPFNTRTNYVFDIYTVFLFMFACFSTLLHLFPIFPEKYEELRGGSRLLHSPGSQILTCSKCLVSRSFFSVWAQKPRPYSSDPVFVRGKQSKESWLKGRGKGARMTCVWQSDDVLSEVALKHAVLEPNNKNTLTELTNPEGWRKNSKH